MKKILAAAAVLTLLAALPKVAMAETAPAAANGAQGRVGIAAVVNEDIITFSDINNRMGLMLIGTSGTPPENVRKEMEHKVLSKLIDEKLELQEAKTLDISVTDDQVQSGFANIAEQNRLPADEFKKRLTESGIKVETLYDQIRAEIAWGQVARRKLRPQINVSESEIDNELIAMKNAPAPAAPAEAAMPAASQSTGPMVHLKQLVILFEPKDPPAIINAKIQRIANLKSEIRNCADMDKKMLEFKNHGTSDLGFGPLNALPAPLKSAVQDLKVGQLSKPVRGKNGVAVLMVCDRKEPEDAKPAAAEPEAEKPAAETADNAAPSAVSGVQTAIQSANLPAAADLTSEQPAAAAPAETPAATVAEKPTAVEVSPADEARRDEAANRIGMRRMNQMQERYLRDLRATAFIDQRI